MEFFLVNHCYTNCFAQKSSKIFHKSPCLSGCLFLSLPPTQTPSSSDCQSARSSTLLPLRTLRALIVNYVCNRCCFEENRIAKPLETLFCGMAQLECFCYLEVTDKILLLLLNLILNSAQTLACIVS